MFYLALATFRIARLQLQLRISKNQKYFFQRGHLPLPNPASTGASDCDDHFVGLRFQFIIRDGWIWTETKYGILSNPTRSAILAHNFFRFWVFVVKFYPWSLMTLMTTDDMSSKWWHLMTFWWHRWWHYQKLQRKVNKYHQNFNKISSTSTNIIFDDIC